MKGCLAVLFLFLLSLASSVLVMIGGWGVKPKSWPIIVGVGLVLQPIIYALLQSVNREDKNK